MQETITRPQPDGISVSRTSEELCSVEITRNSKGYTWTVKAYAADTEAAFVRAMDTEQRIAKVYGGGEG